MKPIKVMIADDQPMFSRGLQSFLDFHEDISVVSTPNTIPLAINDLHEFETDVLVLDHEFLNRPKQGIDSIEDLRLDFPSLEIIIISGGTEDQLVKKAFDSGVAAYVSKYDPPEEMYRAVKRAYEGEILVNRDQLMLISRGRLEKALGPQQPQFTPRQLDIIRYIHAEKTTTEIADKVNVSTSTVENERTEIKRLLQDFDFNIQSMIGIALFAERNGITLEALAETSSEPATH